MQTVVYQGGYLAVNDIDCMKALGIGLVDKCTMDIPALDLHGGYDVPKWRRFPNSWGYAQ